jgi:hypothetical protein
VTVAIGIGQRQRQAAMRGPTPAPFGQYKGGSNDAQDILVDLRRPVGVL